MPSMVILQAHLVKNVSKVRPVKQWLQTDPMNSITNNLHPLWRFHTVFVDFTWCTVIFPGFSRFEQKHLRLSLFGRPSRLFVNEQSQVLLKEGMAKM